MHREIFERRVADDLQPGVRDIARVDGSGAGRKLDLLAVRGLIAPWMT
jgi:hypothetical protein